MMAIKSRIDKDAIKNIKYLIEMGRYKEAQELGEYLLEGNPVMDELGIALCLQLLEVYIILNDGERFQRLFNLYEDLLKNHKDPFVQTEVNLLLGHYYMHISHEYEECIQHYQQSISLAFQHQYHLQLVVAINNIAAALEKQHVPIQTIYQFLKFNIIVAEKMGDQNNISYVEGHLMYFRVMTILRKFESVKKKIALFLEKDLNNKTRVRVLHALQYCQYTAGEYIKSLETSKRALAILEQDVSLKNYVAGYENIYKIMMLAAKAMNLSMYKAYEQQYEHYRQLGEIKTQLTKNIFPISYATEPSYQKEKEFFRTIESTAGTFILIQYMDILAVLPSLTKRYSLTWTCLTNSSGVFISKQLSEQQVDALLESLADPKHYSFCHTNEEGLSGKDYYHLLRAQLYYKERS
jgi:tetratricopeptide (TPR) repeat protein